jgi:hypothetical protein
MKASDLPAGSHPVCPRCGTGATEAIWCGGCGLNLRQQGELPTADAYAAKVRERSWLTEQAARTEAARTEESQAWQRRVAAQAEQRALEKGERDRKRAEKKARGRAKAAKRNADRRPDRCRSGCPRFPQFGGRRPGEHLSAARGDARCRSTSSFASQLLKNRYSARAWPSRTPRGGVLRGVTGRLP